MEVELLARPIADGDLVIIDEGANQTPVYVAKGKEFQNRYGTFRHGDLIGRPFGCKLLSKNGRGFVHALAPTPELWGLALSHRTQILYVADVATIIARLDLQPGSRVIEAGTGSGSLSTALLTAIAPGGHLFTFEFNKRRCEMAAEELARNGFGAQVCTVTHGDVCAEGFSFAPVLKGATGAAEAPAPQAAVAGYDAAAPVAAAAASAAPVPAAVAEAPQAAVAGDDGAAPVAAAAASAAPAPAAAAVRSTGKGADSTDASVDAAIFDLPSPWLVVPAARRALRPGGRFCSFSPCIEQVQRTAKALVAARFTCARVFEVLVKRIEVNLVATDAPRGASRKGTHADDKVRKRRRVAARAEARVGTTAGADADADADADAAPAEAPCAEDRREAQPTAALEATPSVLSVLVNGREEQRGHTGYLLFSERPPLCVDVAAGLQGTSAVVAHPACAIGEASVAQGQPANEADEAQGQPAASGLDGCRCAGGGGTVAAGPVEPA